MTTQQTRIETREDAIQAVEALQAQGLTLTQAVTQVVLVLPEHVLDTLIHGDDGYI